MSKSKKKKERKIYWCHWNTPEMANVTDFSNDIMIGFRTGYSNNKIGWHGFISGHSSKDARKSIEKLVPYSKVAREPIEFEEISENADMRFPGSTKWFQEKLESIKNERKGEDNEWWSWIKKICCLYSAYFRKK